MLVTTLAVKRHEWEVLPSEQWWADTLFYFMCFFGHWVKGKLWQVCFVVLSDLASVVFCVWKCILDSETLCYFTFVRALEKCLLFSVAFWGWRLRYIFRKFLFFHVPVHFHAILYLHLGCIQRVDSGRKRLIFYWVFILIWYYCNIPIKGVALLLRTFKVLVSDLSLETIHTWVFAVSLSHQANARVVLQIRPQLLPSTSVPIHYSLIVP
jgi:hypothetical protein